MGGSLCGLVLLTRMGLGAAWDIHLLCSIVVNCGSVGLCMRTGVVRFCDDSSKPAGVVIRSL
jgi:hypothetical protein